MIRSASFIALLAACSLAACTPPKTPEQIAAEKAAEAMKQMGAIFGGMAGAAGTTPADQQQAAAAMGAAMGAAMAQAGALSNADPNMSPEDRAKMQAALGAMSGGPQNPAAKAYVDQLVKVGPILSSIKDEASARAADAQLAPIFAAMKPSADALNAMSETDREVAMASAAPQMMQFSVSMMGLMAPLMSNPSLGDLVDGIMKKMPEVHD